MNGFKKKIPLIILTVVVLLLAAGLVQIILVSKFGDPDTVVLTYAEVNPLDGTISGAMASAFKEKAEEVSDGELQIDIQAGGVLGNEEQVLDNLLGGGNMADIARISAFALNQYGCQKTSLLGIPYTFSDEDHFWKFADSNLADEMLLEPHEVGLPLQGLCFGEEGFRHFFFRRPVSGLKDLTNRKIRVSADPTMVSMVEDLGASAASVSFGELYSALSTSVVDGAEQPLANYRSNAFDQVAPYLIMDGHTLGVMEIVMADYRWNSLTEEQQGWIREAADYATDVCRQKVKEIEAENYEILQKEGVTFVEVEDKTPWAEACKRTIDKNTGNLKDTYQQLLDMQ